MSGQDLENIQISCGRGNTEGHSRTVKAERTGEENTLSIILCGPMCERVRVCLSVCVCVCVHACMVYTVRMGVES